MSIAYCPKCLAPQNMLLSTTVREETDPQAGVRKFKVDSYQCAACHSFVKSEESEICQEDSGDGSVNAAGL